MWFWQSWMCLTSLLSISGITSDFLRVFLLLLFSFPFFSSIYILFFLLLPLPFFLSFLIRSIFSSVPISEFFFPFLVFPNLVFPSSIHFLLRFSNFSCLDRETIQFQRSSISAFTSSLFQLLYISSIFLLLYLSSPSSFLTSTALPQQFSNISATLS